MMVHLPPGCFHYTAARAPPSPPRFFSSYISLGIYPCCFLHGCFYLIAQFEVFFFVNFS